MEPILNPKVELKGSEYRNQLLLGNNDVTCTNWRFSGAVAIPVRLAFQSIRPKDDSTVVNFRENLTFSSHAGQESSRVYLLENAKKLYPQESLFSKLNCAGWSNLPELTLEYARRIFKNYYQEDCFPPVVHIIGVLKDFPIAENGFQYGDKISICGSVLSIGDVNLVEHLSLPIIWGLNEENEASSERVIEARLVHELSHYLTLLTLYGTDIKQFQPKKMYFEKAIGNVTWEAFADILSGRMQYRSLLTEDENLSAEMVYLPLESASDRLIGNVSPAMNEIIYGMIARTWAGEALENMQFDFEKSLTAALGMLKEMWGRGKEFQDPANPAGLTKQLFADKKIDPQQILKNLAENPDFASNFLATIQPDSLKKAIAERWQQAIEIYDIYGSDYFPKVAVTET
ncbi:MAG: hypothetical protein WCJ58_04010 [bacterium]